MREQIVQTAGRDQPGQAVPMFAHLNGDILFGDVLNEDYSKLKYSKRWRL